MSTRWRHQESPAELEDVELDVLEATVQVNLEPSLTQQQFRDSTDINKLWKRMGITDGSVLPASLGITDPGYYADLEGVPNLREALDHVHETQSRFMALPADVRSRFHNRPELLYEFVTNEANAEESVKLGLLARFESPGVVEPVKPVSGVPQTP